MKMISFWILLILSVSLVRSQFNELDDPKFGPFSSNNLLKALPQQTTSTTTKSTSDQPNCETTHESYDQVIDSLPRVFKEYAIAVDNEICATEGKKIIMKKGSAVDAAIATGLCNGIMNPHSSGIGGGLFMMVYEKKKNMIYAIDAREKAPMSSFSTMFVNSTKSSLKGGSATAIPGEIYGYYVAHKLAGKLPWKDLFEPAIRLCTSGYWVSKALDKVLKSIESDVRKNPALVDLFVNPLTNQLYTIGDRIRRPKLANTLKYISENGAESFYNGKLTKVMVEEINKNGGEVRTCDFNNYRAIVKNPVEVKLDSKLRAFAVPPPSSGFLTAFAIKLMASYSNMTKEFEKDPSIFYHRLVEAFKHTYAYRTQIGDENFLDIQKLIKVISSDDAFLRRIKSKIIDGKTFPPTYYGQEFSKEDYGTSHLAILTSNGDAVSLTSTINTYFGAFYVGEKTGIIYNNQMDDFSTPGLTNNFNLQPSKANYIEPGKRPLSSMSPLIILNEKNEPRLVIGASGGSKIITSVAQVAYKNLFLKSSLKDAIDDRRIHDQLSPEVVQFEYGFSNAIQKKLSEYGHAGSCFAVGGAIVQAIEFNGKTITAVSDARKGGVPDGY